MAGVINVPNEQLESKLDEVNDTTTEQTAATIRHDELMCQLKDMNKQLKLLNTYFSLMMDQAISEDDIPDN